MQCDVTFYFSSIELPPISPKADTLVAYSQRVPPFSPEQCRISIGHRRDRVLPADRGFVWNALAPSAWPEKAARFGTAGEAGVRYLPFSAALQSRAIAGGATVRGTAE